MSYSFIVTATSKAEAKQKITDHFANIVAGQASHKADQDAAVACDHAFVDILKEPPEGQEIYVSMHGSLGWDQLHREDFLSADVSVSASLRVARQVS